MGHQLAGAPAATALTVALVASALVGCGGDDAGGDLPSVLDVARRQVETVGTASSPPERDVASDELPPPDPSLSDGANRVVNLWVGADGETREVDVWGRRTFTTGPILLASDVAFGEATDYFPSPPGYSLVIVGAGAGPDGAELAAIFNADDGEQITSVFTNDSDDGSVGIVNLWERDPTGTFDVPAPPTAGRGAVRLLAVNTWPYDVSLRASVGGRSFYVGDGSGTCLVQRMEEQGFEPRVLGGTQTVDLELDAGRARITLHPWPSIDACAQPATYELDVDVVADRTVLVLVHTVDGSSLAAVQLPVG